MMMHGICAWRVAAVCQTCICWLRDAGLLFMRTDVFWDQQCRRQWLYVVEETVEQLTAARSWREGGTVWEKAQLAQQQLAQKASPLLHTTFHCLSHDFLRPCQLCRVALESQPAHWSA